MGSGTEARSAGYQALHEAYRQREATIAAAMADRAAREKTTRGQRELTVALRVLQVDPRCSADVDWHPAGKPY